MFPLRLMFKDPDTQKTEEVSVFDFIHDTQDTFQSLALCWVPRTESWMTISVALLSPIDSKKKLLKEEAS